MKLVWVFILLTSVTAHTDVLVRVRPHVVVAPESEVNLAQLIDAPNLSEDSQKKLATIAISRAPAYGEKQELASAGIMPLVRSVIENERSRNKDRVHLVLPRSVVIDTLRRSLSADLVSTELTQAWQPLCSDCQLSIENLSLPKVEGIRDWTLKIKGELPRGSFAVAVDLIRENGSLLPAWVNGRLITKRKVPVTKRMMAPSERVQPQDVTWEYRDTSMSYDGIPAADELVGKRLRQGLKAGDILWRSQLEKEKAIHRGEMVQVRSSEAMWEVSISLVAQQDAYIGDVVNLKNPKTNSTIVGEVVGQGEVELR
ncbi:MAG: flagellar basal body P-ring formation protein FlgA [Bdellovibrionales bacterium]|nr:flagellar basal body P-ring formation protein FlgA [Bdellovibrionales bacterium]